MGRPLDGHALGDRYKWTALSNTTLGVFLVTLNASVVIISLPAIFRGIRLNPLQPANISYLLWTLMSYLVVTAVLVVTFGRIGDMFGRARMYNTGFVVFSVAALGLALVPGHGSTGALELIGGRVVQGIGGALLMSNANAILTDAFPANERGMALGINSVAAIAGSFLGLIVGGLLASIDWRLVFLISVPVAVAGSVWGIVGLKDVGARHPARIDWWGNLTFAGGLVSLMVGITYGIQPYGGHTMGWTSPMVDGALVLGVGLLAAFLAVERRVADPLFHLELFGIRAFAAGGVANLLSSMGRGGLQFILIIWLQGIWLPLHGYDFARTPLWAGIYMIPLSAGFLLSGPLSGKLSDRYGGRRFATGGMVIGAATFAALMTLPADFGYGPFAVIIFLNGVGFGLFSAPNSMSIMNAVPARHRGSASGVLATFMNGGFVLSMGVFFSLMVVGLAAHLPQVMKAGLLAQGVPAAAAARAAALPPVGSLFAAFLGYNPMRALLGPALHSLPAARAAAITSRGFFPSLLAQPFHHGLLITFGVALAMCLLSAAVSWSAGGDRAPEPGATDTGARLGLELDAMEAVPSGGAGRL
ncbi:MAG: MFS transporter [Acidimicrobiales bacterium]